MGLTLDSIYSYCCRLISEMILFKTLTVFLLRQFIRRTLLGWLLIAISVIFIVIVANRTVSVTSRTESKVRVLVWWTDGFPGIEEIIECAGIKCDVKPRGSIRDTDIVEAYLFYGSNIDFNDLPLPRSGSDLWALYHEESPRNAPQLMHEAALTLFNYSSTFSRYSDVPFPLQYLNNIADITDTQYFVSTKDKNNLLSEISPVLYLQSDCDTATQRDEYVKELMNYIKIDSYGDCLNNKHLPNKYKVDYLNQFDDKSFLNFIARYKFVIAIENGVCYDYVTEKLWRAIKVGTVPIYFGSPTIRDWLPNHKSALLIEDHPSIELMKTHLEKLLNNDALYEEYLDHKIKGIISNVRLKHHFKLRPDQSDSISTVKEFQCLICADVHRSSPVKIIDKRHYDCPKPVSALSVKVEPENQWLYTWKVAAKDAKDTKDRVRKTSA